MWNLSDGKLYGFLRLLLPAGAETTFRVMGNCRFALLSNPDARAAVYADRGLLPDVIEETLRWETSVTMVSRVAVTDTEVAGCPIRPARRSVSSPARRTATSRAGTMRAPGGSGARRNTTSRSAPARTSAWACTSRVWSSAPASTRSSRVPNLRFDPDADLDEAIVEGYAFRGPRRCPSSSTRSASVVRGRSRSGALRRATAPGRRRGGTSRTRDRARSSPPPCLR